MNNGIYVFLDPFHRKDSGVSTYTSLSKNILEKSLINTLVIKLQHNESIEKFRLRVLLEITAISQPILCIEAPESLASTSLLPSSYPIHIRLHCSRSLGAIVQGESYNLNDVAKEQVEILRAKYVSSPSWAAYFVSLSLFKFNTIPFCYPNPAPPYEKRRIVQKKHDVIFVGRLHKLKGIEYLAKFIRQLPHISFGIVAPINEDWRYACRKNVTYYDGLQLDKKSIYELADTVIVPSIFETSSMVILEALSYGCQVITWEHIGASEYIENNKFIKISSQNTKQFINAITTTCDAPATISDDVVTNINLNFISGLKKLVIYESTDGPLLIKPNAVTEKYLRNLVINCGKKMNKKSNSPLVRKTKKLFKNPKAFFKDSIGVKLLTHKNNNIIGPELSLSAIVTETNTGQLDDLEKMVLPTSSLVITAENEKRKLYCSIPDSGRVEFPAPPGKPKGYVTSFLFSKDEDPEFVEEILEGMNNFPDFSYINKERLLIGDFEVKPEESSLSIINRIDFKNKTNFSNINFIFLLNASVSLCEALRSIGTEQRIILIQTNEDINTHLLSIDALITTQRVEEKKPSTRRIIYLDSPLDIPQAIRRIIQENGSKSPDMLLSLNPENEIFDKNDFINFDYNNYDGILKIKKTKHERFTTMLDFYSNLSGNIIGIAMKESLYMRYKSLCEDIENGAPAHSLIEMCLTDGMIFDVKEI